MAIWYNPLTLTELNATQFKGLTRTLGIAFTELGDDFLRATMRVTEALLQPYGILHGGANITLAETLGSTAAVLCIDRNRFRCVGQEINANHLRPGLLNSLLTGSARAFHVGLRSHVWGIEIRDEQDKLVCVARLTMAVIAQSAA